MKHTPRALVVTAALALTTITAASAQAQDRSPTAAAAPAAQPSRLHLDVEIDPTAYILRGYSLHVGIGWRRLRVDLGAYAMAMPEFMHGNPDFDVSFHGFGVKAQLFPLAEQRGLFVGIDTGLARPLVQRRETDLARCGLQVSVGAHVGWRFPHHRGPLRHPMDRRELFVQRPGRDPREPHLCQQPHYGVPRGAHRIPLHVRGTLAPRRASAGVRPVHRLNARWKGLGSEYPSRYATSATAILGSAR